MHHPKIKILMATYNGELYLDEQLDSFSSQTYHNWHLCVSDDGSTDTTISLLNDYKNRVGDSKVSIYSGPKKGFAANFLSLVCNEDLPSDYYAYSDQDDIWVPDKLQKAVDWLKTVPNDVPALYCGRTELVNASAKHTGYSTLYKRKISFLNALVQNISGGNTMVFNQAACDLLRKAGFMTPVVAHDWWTYMLVTGAGGVVHYDPMPKLLYRQHDGAQIGANNGFYSRLVRIYWVTVGRFKQWNDINCHALLQIKSCLTLDNQQVLDQFIASRNCSLWNRLCAMRNLGVYRQTLLGNLGLTFATLLGKI